MAKDYQVECAELRGRIKELERQLQQERNWREDSQRRAENTRNAFKELLIEVLGK